MRISIVLIVLFGLLASAVSSQEPLASSETPQFIVGDRVDIISRTNVSVRENGRYAGHLQRERRIYLVAVDARTRSAGGGERDGMQYSGEFLATENTIRDLRTVAARVQERTRVDAAFDGERIVVDSDAVPISTAVPTIPDALGRSRSWEAPAVATVDVEAETVRTVPTVVAYRLAGRETYQGREVFRIEYGYFLRWPQSPIALEEHPAAGLFAPELLPSPSTRIRGNRQGVILLPLNGGVPVLQRTNTEEQISTADGTTREYRGFILTWYHTSVPPGRRAAGVAGTAPPTGDTPTPAGPRANAMEGDTVPEASPPSIVEQARSAAIPDVDVEEDELSRVQLSIRELQFIADQARLLPGEANRLDAIASLLREIQGVTILVTGHTADVGSAESQRLLSIARAERIVEALTERGIQPGRLRYEGRGGTDPIADNTTEEGRAANRRVEITLLPD